MKGKYREFRLFMSFQQCITNQYINQYICGAMAGTSNFIVSARKFRPDSFDMVVGQGSITSTLKNAIRTGHIAQAYLFCGPRGVGKTTCARIFAKTINCKNLSANNEACNECESCKSFNQNRSFNIHELDAASNNSVEDIRLLIEKVRIPPQISRFSIYIIDEVHMLSQSAFNAFLKTLEEPPKHAIFILATTEKHKILPTILSRCQIFDFNRIQIKDIVSYLTEIAKKEHIKYEHNCSKSRRSNARCTFVVRSDREFFGWNDHLSESD
jgi:DNA polymerase-3 subunit gamma/tau